MMKPTHIVIHCSDSAFGDAGEIDLWHQERGFAREKLRCKTGGLKHIGYHFVICNAYPDSTQLPPVEHSDGAIQCGRDEDEIGAHAQGMNSALGICLIGKPGIFTPNQIAAMRALAALLAIRHRIPVQNIIGHFETPQEQSKKAGRKTCPGLDMGRVRNSIARVIEALGVES